MLPGRQLSPYLENCCLRLSATVSYEQAEQDLVYLTGIRVSAKTQQRLVHQVGGSIKRLNQAEKLLWQGQVEAAIVLFSNCQRKQTQDFCEYLQKHQHRIVNYEYYQAEGLNSYAFGGVKLYGSGAVESAIKQIGRRVQLSGAQWNRENVPQVLAHRCAYLNGLIGSPLHSD